MQSKYLSFFANLREVQPNFYKLLGSRILVEVLPEEELKTAGGLIVGKAGNFKTTTEEDKFTAVVVISVGAGYYDDDTGEDVPLEVKPGQVIEIVRSGLRRYSNHPILGAQYSNGDLALINESHINSILSDDVDEYTKALNVISDLRSAIK